MLGGGCRVGCVMLRLLGRADAVEEGVEDHRHDGGEQDAGLEQRMQGVRQHLEEVRRHQRDHAEADRQRDDERIEAVGLEVDAAEDADAGVLLVDVVLGFGGHLDPAGELARAVEEMRVARGDAPPITVVATLTGVADDPQDLAAQSQKLEDAGILIAGSVRAAVLLALRLLSPSGAAPGTPPAVLAAPAAVVNIGLRSFADDLAANGVDTVHLQWEPAPEGADRLRRLAASLV